MRKCKKCSKELPQEAQFCLYCGTKYEESIEDTLSLLREEISGLKSEINVLKGSPLKRIAGITHPKKRYRERTIESDEDTIKEMLKHARANPDKAYSFASLFREAYGYIVGGSRGIRLRELLAGSSHYGIRITKTGRLFLIQGTGSKENGVQHKRKNQSEKMKVLATRAQQLIKDEHITQKEAFKRAHAEIDKKDENSMYMLRKNPIVPMSPEEESIKLAGITATANRKKKFPKIEGVIKTMQPVLIDMLNHVVNEGTALDLQSAQAIGIEAGKDYESFMTSLAFHTIEIAHYLGIENKFVFENGGNERKMSYRK